LDHLYEILHGKKQFKVLIMSAKIKILVALLLDFEVISMIYSCKNSFTSSNEPEEDRPNEMSTASFSLTPLLQH